MTQKYLYVVRLSDLGQHNNYFFFVNNNKPKSSGRNEHETYQNETCLKVKGIAKKNEIKFVCSIFNPKRNVCSRINFVTLTSSN